MAIETFAEKVSCFPSECLGEEHVHLLSQISDLKKIATAVHVQFVESALAYAISFLQKPDRGVKDGKRPDKLIGVITDQMAEVAARKNGLDESLLCPALLQAAKAFQK